MSDANEQPKYGTTFFHAVDADGVRKVTGAMTSVDPLEDHHLMTSFLMFHQAVKRGVVFNGRKLGNLYLSSTPQSGVFEPTSDQVAELTELFNTPQRYSMVYIVEPGESVANRGDYEIKLLAAPEPDANCVTAGDGTCVSPVPCMHGQGLDPVTTHGRIVSLTDQLNDLAQAVMSGDGDGAMQLIQHIAHDDRRVAETLAHLNDHEELDDLTCCACGVAVRDPYHFSGEVNGKVSKHIHLCADHAKYVPVIKVEGTTVLADAVPFEVWDELTGHRRMKSELATMLDHDDEPRWKWISLSVSQLKDQARTSLELLNAFLKDVNWNPPFGDVKARNTHYEKLKADAAHYVRMYTPVLHDFRCWSDGTVQQVETSADGLAHEAPSHMSDDYTVIKAPHETAAIRLYAEWEAKAHLNKAKEPK